MSSAAAAAPRCQAAPRCPLRSSAPAAAAAMYLCRAASQALASRLSRAPSTASRLKQRGTRGPPRSSTRGRVEVNGTVGRTRGEGRDGDG